METKLQRPFLLRWMQPGAVLFSHSFGRNHLASKIGESNQLLLDSLQTFVPLSVSNLGLNCFTAAASKLLISLLNVSDLFSQSRNLVSKNN
jgi:hypothetical protein